MKNKKTNLILTVIALLLAGIAPNLFPIAQAGYSSLSVLALRYLIPSAVLLFIIVLIAHRMKFQMLRRQILRGMLAGLIATIGLEIVREIGYRIGWMPGDMPKLLGVLLLNQFAMGPSTGSNLAGWAYHFWNGAMFGVIFSLLFGRSKPVWAVVYALLIGVGFMLSPAVVAMGIGKFGIEYMSGYQFLIVVFVAHIALGLIMGGLLYKWNVGAPNILERIRSAFSRETEESS